MCSECRDVGRSEFRVTVNHVCFASHALGIFVRVFLVSKFRTHHVREMQLFCFPVVHSGAQRGEERRAGRSTRSRRAPAHGRQGRGQEESSSEGQKRSPRVSACCASFGLYLPNKFFCHFASASPSVGEQKESVEEKVRHMEAKRWSAECDDGRLFQSLAARRNPSRTCRKAGVRSSCPTTRTGRTGPWALTLDVPSPQRPPFSCKSIPCSAGPGDSLLKGKCQASP